MRLSVDGALRGDRPRDLVRRSTIIGLISFLTLIDLFGSQALLPRLVAAFETDTATMGAIVNASTFGMAISGLTVAWFSDRIDRKRGIWISLLALSIPTALLGVVDSLEAFLLLRIIQGACMAAAFTLTMTYLSERCDIVAAGGAMAAYVTGNVASNVFGRLAAVSAAEVTDLSGSFFVFSGLNLLASCIAFVLIGAKDETLIRRQGARGQIWASHLRQSKMRSAFLLGFILLFVFVGVFTFVNVRLVETIGLPADKLGVVYLVLIPALATTPLAAYAFRRWGQRTSLLLSFAIAGAGLALTLAPMLVSVAAGLALFGAGTFFAQALTTAFVSRNAGDKAAVANGLYLGAYYTGGLFGALGLGQVFTTYGWGALSASVAILLAIAASIAGNLTDTANERPLGH